MTAHGACCAVQVVPPSVVCATKPPAPAAHPIRLPTHATALRSPVVNVRVRADENWAALSITDLGPGIPPEAQTAVFSRFHQVEKDFTGQQDGMGLGLPFVKKVAELHGGAATLRSKLGAGTTVTVTWPRRKPA